MRWFHGTGQALGGCMELGDQAELRLDEGLGRIDE